jgi:predicted MPP superfamily phosphohydrolase
MHRHFLNAACCDVKMAKIDSIVRRHLSRRSFMKGLIIAGLAGLDVMLLAQNGRLYAKKIEPFWLEVTQVRLKLPRLPKSFSGFRMAQISDMHVGGWMTAQRAADYFKIVMDLSPDAVAITAILLWAMVGAQCATEDRKTRSGPGGDNPTDPGSGVLGNHDYIYDSAAITNMLQQAGVIYLNNSVSVIRHGDDVLHIAGVDDVMEGRPELDDVLKKLPSSDCSILLVHEPDFADKSSSTGRFDLQISGHSHGGQVVLPFIGPPILPDMAHKYPSGLYRVGKMLLYTNRGAGMTQPYVRFNCRPEITVFTLEAATP